MYKIIDGKLIASEMRKKIKSDVAEQAKEGKEIGLAVILVGDNQASQG